MTSSARKVKKKKTVKINDPNSIDFYVQALY